MIINIFIYIVCVSVLDSITKHVFTGSLDKTAGHRTRCIADRSSNNVCGVVNDSKSQARRCAYGGIFLRGYCRNMEASGVVRHECVRLGDVSEKSDQHPSY